MNISDIGKFSKNVFRYNDIVVRHSVSLVNYQTDMKTGKEKYRSPIFEFDLMDKKIREVKRQYAFSTQDSILISKQTSFIKSSNNPLEQKKREISGYIALKPEMFRKIEETLNTGVDWLVKEEYAKLFKIDVNGNTVGLSEAKVASIARFPLSWLMIKPAVIFIKEVGYQGIYLKTDKGIVGSIPGEEYISFVNIMKNLMTNFYQCSLELYNMGLLTLLLKEKENDSKISQ